jgi:pantoate--beta-alanine ligase
MGALHEGHQQLIREASKVSENSLVSVFVNPLQFDSAEDLQKYPRTYDNDFRASSEAGAKFVWFPKHEDLYPEKPQLISSGEIGRKYEGASRPGHFDGMLTVVKRYFDLINPDYAIFGEKDWQQLTLIRNMVTELNLPIKIIPSPTVREESGLAMSSRNARLSAEGLRAASIIFQALASARELSTRVEREKQLRSVLVQEPLFNVDYADEIKSESFSVPHDGADGDRLIVAGWIEGVRLIDNISIGNEVIESYPVRNERVELSLKGLNS